MNFGIIEIRNDGSVEEPAWSVTAGNGDFLTDAFHLDDAVKYLRDLRKVGHSFDSIGLELEDEEDA
jgi:hypothetical protein